MVYEDGPATAAAPATACLKFGKEDETSRQQSAPLFQLECAWYRELADQVPIACGNSLPSYSPFNSKQ
jgi:hypothetical protein